MPNMIEQSYFPKDKFECYFENSTTGPLVISPKGKVDLIAWAKGNQKTVADAIDHFGGVVFSGFDLTKEQFHDAFTALTGMAPENYKGDVPRDQVIYNIYKSTAVANAHNIPLHQEVAGGFRKNMPEYISFFCDVPPAKGMGQTQVGNVEEISKKIQTLMPKFWQQISTKTLTYTTRYLPENSWRTRWIRKLNPSHATIKKRFGTENRKEVEEKCKQEGLTCTWDGAWAVVSRKGVPGTIDWKGKTLFCNAIHLDKLNPKLCGGWINYIFARILLYPTKRSLQFDVKFDDGTTISPRDASKLLSIFQQHQQGRDWKQGDLMILNNITTMHAKTPHVGVRNILVAMCGSVLNAAKRVFGG